MLVPRPALLLAATFPTTGILDDFNRADVNPLAGNWSQPILDSEATRIRIASNQIEVDPVFPGTANAYAYWNVQDFGPDCEVYARASSLDLEHLLYVRLQTPGSAAADGYRLRLNHQSASTYIFQIYRIDNGVSTQVGANSATFTIAANDLIGFEAVGSTLKGYHKPSAGSWTEILSRSDSTYTGAGKIGISLNSFSRADDFGGGTAVSGGGVRRRLLMGVGE